LITKKDFIIMSHLRQNCRATLTSISKKTNIPISTIFEKIKRNEENIIRKNTCLVDFAKLGFNTRAKIVLKSNITQRKELSNFLIKHQNINSVYKINNGFDYLIESVFKNMRDLEDFLEILLERFKVKKYETYFIIDDLKTEAFMSDPETLDLVLA